MIDETRIERLEVRLRRTGRVNTALAGLLIAALAGAAMPGAGQISRGAFAITDASGKPSGTVLDEKGDVTVGGKLTIKGRDVFASNIQLPVGSVVPYAGDWPPYRNTDRDERVAEADLGWMLCDGREVEKV